MTLIELDRDLIASLRDRFPHAEIIASDVLTVPLDAFARRRVVGNLPYNISTPLLMRLLNEPSIVDMHFMLQREVAIRLTASPGTKAWGRLSVMAQYGHQIEALFDVGADAFRPKPKVESTFVRLQPMAPPYIASVFETFADLVRAAFLQRRKKLANSLASYRIDWVRLGLDSDMRADHASIADYVNMANSIETP